MGYMIKNGVNYYSSDSVSLTQAQYDALVQAGTVDPNTTYFITDRNCIGSVYASGISYDPTISGLSATNVQLAVDELSNRNKYSTSEHLVGAWIDGTPLYERTVVVEVPSTIESAYYFDLDDIPISNPDYNIIMLQSYITHVNVPNQYNLLMNNREGIMTISGTTTDVPVINDDVKVMVDLSEGAYIGILMGTYIGYAVMYYNATVTCYVTIRYTKNPEPNE